VNRFIPFSSELVPCRTIPPGVVETSICELRDFRKHIEHTFENDVERKEIQSNKPVQSQ
jgi:D-serine dehydratase